MMETQPSIHLHVNGNFEVWIPGNNSVTCHSRADAELVLDFVRRFYEGNTGRKLARETLAALGRAGLQPANSVWYRSAMHHVANE